MTDIHTMTHLFTRNGFDHLLCFECGRQVEIAWEPLRVEIIEQGDATIAHVNGKLKVDTEVIKHD